MPGLGNRALGRKFGVFTISAKNSDLVDELEFGFS